jgi:hypothetical protein
MLTERAQLDKNQEGFASLVIAIVLVLVLSLITVGFAQLMTREQNSALNKQLTNQAYYAAEAGVNDAAKALDEGYSTPKTACQPLQAGDAGYSDPAGPNATQYLTDGNQYVGGTSSGVQYTCLLINPTPPDLEYGSIGTVGSKVVEITGVDSNGNPVAIKNLFISWQDPNGNTNFVGSGQTFYPANQWNYPGILRASLVPLDVTNLTNMTGGEYTAFLYPNAGGSPENDSGYQTYPYGSGEGTNQGVIDNGNCNTGSAPLDCNVEITGLTDANYILDMRSIYDDTRVTIRAQGITGQFLNIKNAQTMVDSTGEAQDILRRIQVRVPSRNNYAHSDYDLESMSGICKQLSLTGIATDTNTDDCD